MSEEPATVLSTPTVPDHFRVGEVNCPSRPEPDSRARDDAREQLAALLPKAFPRTTDFAQRDGE